MSNPEQPSTETAPQVDTRVVWTVPNILCAIRLLLAIVMVPVALAGQPVLLLVLFLVAAATDWIDGKLAIWLRQRTSFGARLDSVADAAMYAALLFGTIWLKGDVLRGEAWWIAAALACYVISCIAGLLKFHTLPSYHTYSAKITWLLMIIATVALFTGWAIWPLRVAMVALAVANIESLLITLVSHQSQVDLPTLWHALQRQQADSSSE